MKKSNLLATILGFAALPLAHATTVGFSPSPGGRTLQNSLGVNLSTSSLVWAGNFTSESFSLNTGLTLQQNVNAIIGAGGWEQFGFDTASAIPTTSNGGTGALTVSAGAKLGGSITDDSTGATKADYFNLKTLYVWIFNAATVAAATEMGIFKATIAANPWVFPANTSGLGDSNTFTTQPASTTLVTTAAVGGVGTSTETQLQTAPVPEPSTALLTALGLLGMASRRRRNVR